VLDDFVYETALAQLRPGDTVLMVTDGVTEALDPGGVLFSTGRVTALATEAAGTPARCEPARLVADLVGAVRTFREPFEPADDVTLLAVEWLGAPDAGVDRPEVSEP
jgi:sigma-B regulation protein RsbU (phosphoserine phosphatase)